MLPEDVTLGEGQKRFMVMPDGTNSCYNSEAKKNIVRQLA